MPSGNAFVAFRTLRLLVEALEKMALSLDDKSPMTHNRVPVTVLAEEGQVAENAVILADSKPCKNPICGVVFVPKVWNQDYCCPTCKAIAKKIRAGKYYA